VLPFALDDFRTAQLASVGAYLIAIVGLDVLTGGSGQISLGHGAFMAVGGYSTAILVANHGVRGLWAVPVAAGVAGAIGIVAGSPLARLSGFYLALATFAFAVVLPTILTKFDHFTGGSSGLTLAARPNVQLDYGLTWAVACVLFLAAWWLLESRFGRSLRALRDSEAAAVASGVNRLGSRVLAFAVSAGFAGVGGALFVLNAGHVSPGTFPIELSLYLLVGAVVGLFCSIWGALFGALTVEFLPDVVGAKQAGPATFFFGLVLVALMLVLPLVLRAASRLGYRRFVGVR
jgi:branched-chain amino acid transport system permease protein